VKATIITHSIVVAGVVRLLDPTPGMDDGVEERQ
jgi:hypothetical protein